MTLTARPLILLLVLCLLAIGLVMVLDTGTADAHTPACKSAYPWFKYRTTVYVLPDLYWVYFYNASTGATHRHACYAWQL